MVDMILSQSAGRGNGGEEIDAICLGSGRFLRSVLVPFLSSQSKPAVFQTRGRNFLDSFEKRDGQKIDLVDGGGTNATVPSLRYPVDTIEFDGATTTSHVNIYAAGTLGTADGKSQLMNGLLSNINGIAVIGVGVTEAGLRSADAQCMLDLTQLLHTLFQRKTSCANPNGKVCIINTDNVPNNGDVIRSHVLENARKLEIKEGDDSDFVGFVTDKVAFLNSMVDRITSSRPDSNGLVPLCEPLPKKALVICDQGKDLPLWMGNEDVQARFGVKIRHDAKDLESDIALKLRVANGTHMAVAHTMALLSLVNTEALCDSSPKSSLLLDYLDSLYESQILPAAVKDGISAEETNATWDDWRQRLQHPHFGLSTFFITQNGAAKCGIRLGPTIKSLVSSSDQQLSVSMAFAVAAILRYFTPASSTKGRIANLNERIDDAKQRGIYVGWLDNDGNRSGTKTDKADDNCARDTVTYADGLRYNLNEGWYEFRCDCLIPCRTASSCDFNELKRAKGEVELPEALSKFNAPMQPCSYQDVIRSYLLHPQGGNLQTLLEGCVEEEEQAKTKALDTFVGAVSTLYARMVSGDGMFHMLREMSQKDHVYHSSFSTPCNVLDSIRSSDHGGSKLHYCRNPIPETSGLVAAQNGLRQNEVYSVVFSEVRSQLVIDLHTHLLPPSHGALCLWGIDELLTYHYLVAEYFITAPSNITPENFYSISKKKQADLVWDALFVQRSPLSEATRGVLTTLVALGLGSEVESRDLGAIRRYYNSFRDKGLSGIEAFVDKVYQISGVRYAIMTNIPFDQTEAKHWRPKKKEYPATFRSALRVDPFLSGDKEIIESALKASGYGTTLADARQYLHDWCDTLLPEYMMASTPHDFYLPPSEGGGTLAGVKKVGVNEESLKAPFAFTDLINNDCQGCEDTDNIPSIINENSDFLNDVLMPVCQERNLPLALKIGAHRAVNPELLSAGDGVVAFADAGSLARLCGRFPKVRFLATFLSRANQHEACVLASKFRNLHLYGCWWFCNNPSIIKEITSMRIEMLGTSFTAQHSDARVMDQLIYKWAHSRAVIAEVLAGEYQKTISSGWKLTRKEIRRDVSTLFGSSYEEFMRKSL